MPMASTISRDSVIAGISFPMPQGDSTLRQFCGAFTEGARHIHVRVQPPGGAILTTQLYFPDEPANQADFLFNPALLLKLVANVSPLQATFDFVL
jgi:protocatechuate 3,4-dioxygenase beta subunit